MKCKYSLLGLAAGTALLVATGCSKQDSATPGATDKPVQAPASAAAAKSQAVETPKSADTQPAVTADKPAAVAAQPAAAPATTSATATPAPATPSPAPATPSTTTPAVTPATNAVATPAAPAAAATALASTNNSLASALQSAVQPQQVSFAYSATNQLQTLAAGATNQVMSALGLTNQVASTATNQVEALLANAKSLSANQKYQEALSNVTQLYTTKLTPDQKQKADDLKAQIQAQIQSNLVQKASSALGGFFGGKK